MKDPREEIFAQCCSAVRRQFNYTLESAPGDSEIEKLFYLALWAAVEYTRPHIFNRVICDYGKVRMACSETNSSSLIVRPQEQIDKFRVDFLIEAYDWSRVEWVGGDSEYVQEYWRQLVVECDGHDFHERTKEQAARDKSRDRALTLSKYTVMRFTGSELWRDPIGCAEQVIKWCENM